MIWNRITCTVGNKRKKKEKKNPSVLIAPMRCCCVPSLNGTNGFLKPPDSPGSSITAVCSRVQHVSAHTVALWPDLSHSPSSSCAGWGGGGEMMSHNTNSRSKQCLRWFLWWFSHTLAPRWAAGSRPGRHIWNPGLVLQMQTHFGLRNHKLSVDFIDLAVNQLVNYLISKALWVTAEPPSSLQCVQVSLNHMGTHAGTRCAHARQIHAVLKRFRLKMTRVPSSLRAHRPEGSSIAHRVQISQSQKDTDAASALPSQWVTTLSRSRRPLLPARFPSRSVIHRSVWVKMHNELMKRDWRNHGRYRLNYWPAARPICLPWRGQPAPAAQLTNLIKCTKW